jgi:hypothetical protein
MRQPKASAENEQASISIDDYGRVLVRQIAGLVARRIVTDGRRVTGPARGTDGLIRFARVDVFVPPAFGSRQVGDVPRRADHHRPVPLTAPLPRPEASRRRRVVFRGPAPSPSEPVFGIWGIVSATREIRVGGWSFLRASSTLDGRVAPPTSTRFGAELDSLVDIVSFVARAHHVLLEFQSAGRFGWVCYIYIVGGARSAVQRDGGEHPDWWFTGLPLPRRVTATWYPSARPRSPGRLAWLDLEHRGWCSSYPAAVLMVSSVKYGGHGSACAARGIGPGAQSSSSAAPSWYRRRSCFPSASATPRSACCGS